MVYESRGGRFDWALKDRCLHWEAFFHTSIKTLEGLEGVRVLVCSWLPCIWREWLVRMLDFSSVLIHPRFYLGYLRGGHNLPHPPPPPPQKNILLPLQYISNCIGKIIQTRRDQCTWSKYPLSTGTIWQGTRSRLKNEIKYHCNISQNCVSKCTRLHLSAYSFQKITGTGGRPPDPARKLMAFGHSGLLSQTINPR